MLPQSILDIIPSNDVSCLTERGCEIIMLILKLHSFTFVSFYLIGMPLTKKTTRHRSQKNNSVAKKTTRSQKNIRSKKRNLQRKKVEHRKTGGGGGRFYTNETDQERRYRHERETPVHAQENVAKMWKETLPEWLKIVYDKNNNELFDVDDNGNFNWTNELSKAREEVAENDAENVAENVDVQQSQHSTIHREKDWGNTMNWRHGL